MRRQLLPAIIVVLTTIVTLGIVYPLAVTGVAQLLFHDEAEGSLVKKDGEVVGSRWIGQQFTQPEYFHPRPSAAGEDGYDASLSLGSNWGPTNPDLLAAVEERTAAYREENGLADDAEVPVDAVTASGSGLDPHISVANARGSGACRGGARVVRSTGARSGGRPHRRTRARLSRRTGRQRARDQPRARRPPIAVTHRSRPCRRRVLDSRKAARHSSSAKARVMLAMSVAPSSVAAMHSARRSISANTDAATRRGRACKPFDQRVQRGVELRNGNR